MNEFPNAVFEGHAHPDWKDAPDEDADDEPIETPHDVIAILGFDPAKEFGED